jgi:acyl-coenzyme A synthetase/AMP-(fatty) acid ligase
LSLVKARKNPIIGSVVAAEVVPTKGFDTEDMTARNETLMNEILEICHSALAPYKVPAAIHFVSSLAVTASGKLAHHQCKLAHHQC